MALETARLIHFGKVIELKPAGEFRGRPTKPAIVMLCPLGDGQVTKKFISIEEGHAAPAGLKIGEVQGIAVRDYPVGDRKVGYSLLPQYPVFPCPQIKDAS